MERRADRRRHHIIYRTTCAITGRYYVGMHSTDDINDSYLGSGKRLHRSIKRHGTQQHIREIIEECDDRKALVKREEEIVNDKLLKDPLCMNLARGGLGGAESGERNSFFGRHHTPETISQISASMKNERGPCYGRTGNKHPMFGKQHTAAASQKMSAAHIGKRLDPKHSASIKAGHARRNEALYGLDARILRMLDEGISRREIVDVLGVKINAIYGATTRRKLRSARQTDLAKDSEVVVRPG